MARTNTETTPTLTSSSTKTKLNSQPSIFVKRGSVRVKSPVRPEKSCAEVSFKDFLNFLRIAYEISGNVEGNPPPEKEFEWNNISTNELIASIFGISDFQIKQASEHVSLSKALEEARKELADADMENKILSLKKAESSHLERLQRNKRDSLSDISSKTLFESSKSVEHMLKRKLNEVIHEGLLDSVLPYVVPKSNGAPQSAKKSDMKKALSVGERGVQLTSSKEKPTTARRKSNTASGEVEVEIHVCDEVKNLKRDFRCSQKLLVSKMGYFAEVTTGSKLEDMDISVHCDITIFDWLMRWVKQDSLPPENWPKLDPANVVPIMVSSAFLQMDPLLQDCLAFCRNNMNDIIKTSNNLACLNDSILTRLAALFSNSDVEELRDKKDKIKGRLFCKLITSLSESSPEPARGHFSSLAGVYRCGKCDRLVLRQLGAKILCKPCNMKIDRYGNIHASHTRDPNWNLSDYIRSYYEELKSWRAVYWRLWGDCHFMFCASCHAYFPMSQTKWCCYHPEQPQFFTMEHQRSTTYPIGRYPCCGARSYRYEVLRNESGCQYREHMPIAVNDRDASIQRVYIVHEDAIAVDPPQVMYPERLTKIVSSRVDTDLGVELSSRELLWWEGLEIAPPLPRQGLLSKMWEGQLRRDCSTTAAEMVKMCRLLRRDPSRQPSATDVPVPTDAFKDVPTHLSTSEDDNEEEEESSSSDTGHSEESRHKQRRKFSCIKSKLHDHHSTHSRQWLSRLSIRSNQDNQREFEEQAMRQMVQLLTRRTCGDSAALFNRSSKVHHPYYQHSIWNNHITPIGGTYVRMEQEWKELHNCQPLPNRQRSVTNSFSARPKLRGNR
ncbi:SANT and BTB domain regulator of class switch recombination [Anabrus simplex]|uniref:SANT and BTB domain regulator of class switch recombination n=1 Tax=Anabrus simplex TaxID=316456 RepID=UPI0034DD8AE8